MKLAMETCRGDAKNCHKGEYSSQGKKKNTYAEVVKIYSKNKCSICEVVKKERGMHASLLSHL